MATSIAFYWFLRMWRGFRHQLIMLLIFGDAMRASWYLIFCGYGDGEGGCDDVVGVLSGSGWLIHFGTEVSGKWSIYV